ncbi:MAG: hypothetical protein N2Z75_08125 [Meiothermus sp.]|uniref:hypothetical protein n=1 Tax=Meiothermus sp. TaxID=1955249 RepID=UPI0025DDC6EC|nr:hypothetical protein [Meiothermus sp.]MCS7068970.1 hypothetical protein [Meiothermus sp.]MCX7601894.1 hypothetical protein [Meiothermus sp.]MDW8426092.1 hypothetical protein [Meiothermus sp.]
MEPPTFRVEEIETTARRKTSTVLANPLPAQFWLWGQDALAGILEAYGFQKEANPTGRGSSLYLRGGLGLHSSAAWLHGVQGVVFYHRPSESFFWLQSTRGLPELPRDRKPLPLQDGMDSLHPWVYAYESWIVKRYGPDYRRRQLEQLPPLARRSLPAWQSWVRLRSDAGAVPL